MIRNTILLIAISLAWASNYLLIGKVEGTLAPFTLSAFMTGFAAIALLVSVPVLLHRPLLQPLKKKPWLVVVMSLTAITLPNISVVIAEQRITSDMASLVGTTVPVLTFLITVFVLRSNAYSHLRMLGVIIAVCGVITYIGWGSILSDASEVTGILIMMSGGLVFALNGIFAASNIEDVDCYSLTALILAFSALQLIVLAIIFERHLFQLPDTDTMLSLAGAGIICNAMAYLGYYVLLSRSGAYFTSLYAYLVPILGVVLGVIFLGESLSRNHLTGLVIVLAGLWLLTHKATAKI